MRRVITDNEDMSSDEAAPPPPSGGRQQDGTGPVPGQQTVDAFQLAVAARRRRRSARELPRLVMDAMRLLWEAGRGATIAAVAIQLSTALLLVGQVLVAQWALAVLLDADGTIASAGEAALPITVLAVLTAAAGLLGVLTTLQQRLLNELVAREVWRRVMGVTEVVDLATFEDPGFYDQLQRVQVSAATRTVAITQGMISMVSGALGITGLGVAIVALEPLLLPLLLLSGLPLLWSSRRQAQLEFQFAVDQTPALRERFYLQSVLTGRDEAKEVRAFHLGEPLRARHGASYVTYIGDLRRHVRARVRYALLGNGGAAVMTAATLLLVVWFVDAGRLTLPEAGAALIAVRLLAGRVSRTFAGMNSIFESGLFLQDLAAFLARRPQTLARRSEERPPLEFGEVTVEDVSFSYVDSERASLDGVDLTIRRGEVVALVGENGSGKTTLAKLLAGLYEPTSGSVRWDGRDIREYDPDALRQQIAVIFQDFVHYQLTARENITLGRSALLEDRDAARQAAVHAGADAFLSRLPAGYETLLSKEFHGGVDLSLGQWQRVALARAFVRDAPLVILDEPSASLDARAEHDLFQRIRSLLAGRTVLLISHRFSSVRSADRIYVLSEGRIVESGDHDALMAAEGLYAELFTLQASQYLQKSSTGLGEA